MNYFIFIFVFCYLIEIKDFINNGGFSNAIAFNLLKMNIYTLLIYILPENLLHIVYFFMSNSAQKIFKDGSGQPINIFNNKIERSTSKRRMNRFQENLTY